MKYRVVTRSQVAISRHKLKCHVSSYNTDKAWRATYMNIVQVGDVLVVKEVSVQEPWLGWLSDMAIPMMLFQCTCCLRLTLLCCSFTLLDVCYNVWRKLVHQADCLRCTSGAPSLCCQWTTVTWCRPDTLTRNAVISGLMSPRKLGDFPTWQANYI